MDIATLLALGVLSVEALTADINNLPRTPTRIGTMGLFNEQGISTTVALVGLSGNQLTLVPNVPRGAPSQPKALTPRNARAFTAPHLPQRSTVMADSLQGIRTFGLPADAGGQGGAPNGVDAAVRATVNALQAVHRRDLDATIEYHRLGAIKGLVLDADGSTIFDLYDEFGVTQQTVAMALGTATTNVKAKINQAKRLIEANLGGVLVGGYHAFCGSAFFDDFVGHERVEKAYANYDGGSVLRADNRRGFDFGGVLWEEYEGSINGDPLIDPNEAFLFPVGVPDMFITRFAPADYMETINTIGLPYYSKPQAMDFNKGLMLESQSNPLNLNTRPGAVVRLTRT